MTTIPRRRGGYLTDEEERIMRETMNRDPSQDEVYEGSPDARVVFGVEFDHPMMIALDAILGDDRTDPVVFIQRWVEERLAAEVVALGADQPSRAARSA
jgi:hypothetical protein